MICGETGKNGELVSEDVLCYEPINIIIMIDYLYYLKLLYFLQCKYCFFMEDICTTGNEMISTYYRKLSNVTQQHSTD